MSLLRLDCGDRAFLFPGFTKEVSDYKRFRDNKKIDADVLLASSSNKEVAGSIGFIKSVAPDYVVASRKIFHFDRFSGPDQKNTKKKGKITALNTNRHGTVSFTTDGKNLTVQTFTLDPMGR